MAGESREFCVRKGVLPGYVGRLESIGTETSMSFMGDEC